MAKKALIEKNNKRIRLIAAYREKRLALKKEIRNKNLSIKERLKLQAKMNDLPLNSCAVRKRNRCAMSGRPRGVFRQFQISRMWLRILAGNAMLPGVMKLSW